MSKEEKTIPLSAVELMADLQFENLTSSTKMVAECDLNDVRKNLEGADKLIEARDLLVHHLTQSEKMGVRHIWVNEATFIITGVIKELRDRLESEEQRLVERIASLEQELEEHERKKVTLDRVGLFESTKQDAYSGGRLVQSCGK